MRTRVGRLTMATSLAPMTVLRASSAPRGVSIAEISAGPAPLASAGTLIDSSAAASSSLVSPRCQDWPSKSKVWQLMETSRRAGTARRKRPSAPVLIARGAPNIRHTVALQSSPPTGARVD